MVVFLLNQFFWIAWIDRITQPFRTTMGIGTLRWSTERYVFTYSGLVRERRLG